MSHPPASLALPAPSSAGVTTRRGNPWHMVAGGVLLGTLGVFVQEAAQDPLTTVWFRCAFGALALAAWAAATGRLGEFRLDRRGVWVALGAGCLTVLNWALFFAAIERTSIAVATVVFHVQPFWVMALAAWWLHEPVSRRQWAATAVALVGLVLAMGLFGHGAMALAPAYLWGVAMCLGGSLSYAVVTLIARSTGSVSPLAMAWWQCMAGAVLTLPWMLWHGLPPLSASWAWLIGLGVVHTGLAYVLLFAGMAGLAAGRIAVLQFVYPITAVIVDWAVYGRALGRIQQLGVGLMVFALAAARRSGTRPRKT